MACTLVWLDVRLRKVPQIARKKIEKAQSAAFVRFCISNARRHSTALDAAITEDCCLEDLADDGLRALLCAANSVEIGFKPVLKVANYIGHD